MALQRDRPERTRCADVVKPQEGGPVVADLVSNCPSAG
jgi:hypothetical protein